MSPYLTARAALSVGCTIILRTICQVPKPRIVNKNRPNSRLTAWLSLPRVAIEISAEAFMTDRTKLPPTVYLLGLTIFSLVTAEFMVAGMMPALAESFSVSRQPHRLLCPGHGTGWAACYRHAAGPTRE